jgi:phage terminase Nu1 subunit (DNA packaging protein)
MDTSLPPDLARKLLNKDLANLVQRVQKGGKLTRAERAMLQNVASSTVGGEKLGPAFARNYVDLAEVLGVTRQSLTTWRKRKDAPTPAANGLHDVAAWRDFMQRHDLKGAAPAADEETALRARKLLAEVEDRELKVAVKKALYVSIEEVSLEWARVAGRVTSLLRNKFENELPPILSGLDATGIQEENRRAIDEVLTLLNQGHG